MSPEPHADPHEAESRGARSGASRERLRRCVSVAVALVGVGVLTAACGGGSASSRIASIGSVTTTVPTGSATPSLSSVDEAKEQKLAYAQCMRSHGDSGFPDPGVANNASEAVNAGAVLSAPGYASANKTCDHLLPNDGGSPTAAETQQELQPALRYVQCMRKPRLPEYGGPNCRGRQPASLPAGGRGQGLPHLPGRDSGVPAAACQYRGRNASRRWRPLTSPTRNRSSRSSRP
jgi:hypothetical protein